MKVIPGPGAAVLFAVSLGGAILCGAIFPVVFSGDGAAALRPWMFNGLWAFGLVALISAPFGWRGLINWRRQRRP